MLVEVNLQKNIEILRDLLILKQNSNVDFSIFAWISTTRCGINSNIPFCCILFFLFCWRPLFVLLHFKIIEKLIYFYPGKNDYHYVPCFFCLILNKKRKLYKCDVNCYCSRIDFKA